jgi:hypothetical protein
MDNDPDNDPALPTTLQSTRPLCAHRMVFSAYPFGYFPRGRGPPRGGTVARNRTPNSRFVAGNDNDVWLTVLAPKQLSCRRQRQQCLAHRLGAQRHPHASMSAAASDQTSLPPLPPDPPPPPTALTIVPRRLRGHRPLHHYHSSPRTARGHRGPRTTRGSRFRA